MPRKKRASKRAVKKKPLTKPDTSPAGYHELLDQLKERIHGARLRAILGVNRELVLLYWQIGHDILARQQDEGWGAKVIDHVSTDLRKSFPQMRGFSPRNLKYMRAFAEAWPDEQIVQQAAAQIPWFHNGDNAISRSLLAIAC